MAIGGLVALVCMALAPRVYRRWLLSRGKHRSLAGHSIMAKRITRLIPPYAFDLAHLLRADDAPAHLVTRRQAGFERLAHALQTMAPLTRQAHNTLKASVPDARFLARYRAPLPFAAVAEAHLPIGHMWQHAEPKCVVDLDGNRFVDVTGSYGVNLLGHAFYDHNVKQTLTQTASPGMLLGGYQPAMIEVVQRLRSVSGLDQVSFHMSGTEAVMQAVRLARYHSGKPYVVRFAGAYHGWWEDVQPGPGNPMPPRETLTLADMSERALRVLQSRHDIACVLVNPLQALHPNRNAPTDATLLQGVRTSSIDRAAYTAWLQRLRQVCQAQGIALIMDEVFMGFRLGARGAQAYFDVQADMVCYGKTLGGGLAVGVVCGSRAWMERFKPEQPAHVCFARGTFNAHPHVVQAMLGFLRHIDTPAMHDHYRNLEATWDQHRQRFNAYLAAHEVPMQAQGMVSVWTIDHLQAGRYNWLIQYYLRQHGVALSWVGTGRLIWSHDFEAADVLDVAQRFVAAYEAFVQDGWTDRNNPINVAHIRKQLTRELWGAIWRRGWRRRPHVAH